MAKSGKTRNYGEQVDFGFVAKRYTLTTISSNKTFGNNDAGYYTMSGSAVVTGTLPAVSKCVGSEWGFVIGSVHGHVLESHTDDAGSNVFSVTGSMAGADGEGTKMVLPALVGSSVVLKSDGTNYLVLAHSGTLTVGS